MKDLFKLILGVLTLLFKSRAKSEAEILILRQRSMCFAGGHRNERHLNKTDRFLFVWLGSPPSLARLRLSGRRPSSLALRWVSSVLALAIAQPCWQTEGLA
jgi:hypothetical protein